MQYKIILDKQSRINPSSEKKEYIIDIEELRKKGDVYDSLVITPEEDYVIRRLSLSEYNVVSILPKPIKQPITNINIELFEGDNYIYLVDMTGNIFYAEYLIKNDFNNTYATKIEMNTAITQTAEKIQLEVNKKVDEKEFGTKIVQNYESVQISWNQISEFIQFIQAQLQIKNENKKLLMALDKYGIHFYKESGEEIGDIGLVDGNRLAFALKNGQGSMDWGIKYKDTHSDKEEFYPVFNYYGKMVGGQGGSDYTFTGFFDMLADLLINEKKIFLGKDDTSSFIQGTALGNVSIILKGLKNNLGFSLEDENNNPILFMNKKQCNIIASDSFTIENEYGDTYLNMYQNVQGKKVFDFGNNLVNASNLASSPTILLLEGNFVNDSLLVADRDSDKSFWLHSDNSDKNLKRDIKESKINAIDKLNKIQHYEFSWKSNNNYVDNGYIAQELEKIDSNYVYKDKISNHKYRYQVNTLKILSDVTKAIQEQQKEIQLLKNKIAELEAKING